MLIAKRVKFHGSVWSTDDRSALRHAARQGITTRETLDLMNEAVVDGC